MTGRFPEDPALPQVLSAFGVEPSALLGAGGEATVYALDRERVLRVHRPGPNRATLARRASLLAELEASATALPFAIPRVLELSNVHDRWISIERRFPGRLLADALRTAEPPARERLVRSYLEAGRQLAAITLARPFYGDLLADDAIETDSFRQYLKRRARRSLDRAGTPLSQLDAGALARDLPEATAAAFVYLDAHPTNVLVDEESVTAVVDFGGAAILGERRFGAVVPATYLRPEDQPIAQAWLREQGLADLYEPTRRWVAAFWSFARDDTALYEWCCSVLLG